MPLVPIADAAIISVIDQASFDEAKATITAYWNHVLAQGMQIDLPEPKAVDTFYSSLIYDLIAIDHVGPDYIQTVNKLHYHSFYLRDGADIVHSYDVTGYPQIAKECLEFFAKKQQPDGNFLSQPQQYDGWGEAVWAYAQHYRITHDKAFAEWAIPQIDRAVDWLHQARAADPLHIVPASNVRDNEYVPGHLTGYNFLALDGLRLAIEMANETGHAELQKNGRPSTTTFTRHSSKCSTRRPPRTTVTSRLRSMGRQVDMTGAICSPSSRSQRSIRTIPALLQHSKPRRPNTPKAS